MSKTVMNWRNEYDKKPKRKKIKVENNIDIIEEYEKDLASDDSQSPLTDIDLSSFFKR